MERGNDERRDREPSGLQLAPDPAAQRGDSAGRVEALAEGKAAGEPQAAFRTIAQHQLDVARCALATAWGRVLGLANAMMKGSEMKGSSFVSMPDSLVCSLRGGRTSTLRPRSDALRIVWRTLLGASIAVCSDIEFLSSLLGCHHVGTPVSLCYTRELRCDRDGSTAPTTAITVVS